MIEKNTFTVIDNEGNEKECFVLFTFDNDVTEKSYVVYTDNTFDDNGRIQVYASTYIPNEKGNITDLFPVETAEEWELIEGTLKDIQRQIRNGNLDESEFDEENEDDDDENNY